ncbi:TPA: hypothetical protein JG825_003491 [Vibrio parahaemolyticus]|uniref:hypothetical protein n=1 Tax=Vibrio campbellii TaxID=680 RepID=UPI002058374D|nr:MULTISPECIES: hypothetical protein [Vibrio harveyi group]MCR9909702.1 hypothetical protein [Vibrio campbellii]UPR19047.1 hypothetical protein H9J99_26225 [Vibrio parahaemolyticus]HAV1520172.1 hypothetical protein [Vibrio parahaemolyticus]HAV1539138.1 hypothetical protein [Vibrio parahaemolyticus]
MCDTNNFAKSLTELVNDVNSTIPYAKQNGYLAISADMSLDVAQEIVGVVESYQASKAYITTRISELEADKKGQTMEVKAVINGALNELKKLQDELGEEGK